jgi:hypothetical protein
LAPAVYNGVVNFSNAVAANKSSSIFYEIQPPASPIPGKCAAVAYTCNAGNISNEHENSTNTKYIWDCLGINNGTDDKNCSADIWTVPHASCGNENNLCINGAINVDHPDSTTQYLWSCFGPDLQTVECSLAKPPGPSCGGSMFTCVDGSPTGISESETQNLWQCVAGSQVVSCSSSKTVLDGECAPYSGYGCANGGFNLLTPSSTEIRWQCLGSGGGTNASCSMPTPVRADGICGVYSGGLGRCDYGNSLDVVDSSTQYLWQCTGTGGGATVPCSQDKPAPQNGACSTSLNSCISGFFVDVGDAGGKYLWNCNGSNGGYDVACSLDAPTTGIDFKVKINGEVVDYPEGTLTSSFLMIDPYTGDPIFPIPLYIPTSMMDYTGIPAEGALVGILSYDGTVPSSFPSGATFDCIEADIGYGSFCMPPGFASVYYPPLGFKYNYYLDFTSPSFTLCPTAPTGYPTDKWDRVWCDGTYVMKLADNPDESSLDFDNNWGYGFVGGIQADNIGFRSGRTINFPTTGNYTFSVGYDDNLKIWVDGVVIYDSGYNPFNLTGFRSNAFQSYMSAGDHQVRMDYSENTAEARVAFSITPPPMPCPSAPGSYPTDRWDRTWCIGSNPFFATWNFTTKLADISDESAIQFDNNWGSGDLITNRANNTGFRSGRTINFPVTGDYDFTVGSDDGTKVWIDGSMVYDSWSSGLYSQDTFTTHLTAGNHQVRIDYFEETGDARISFTYSTTAAPDLTASTITPTTATTGASQTFTFTASNIGAAPTGAAFNNLFQFDDDTDHNTIVATRVVSTGSLGAGASANVSSPYTFPSSGTWYVRACADNNASWVGTISESNENNNCGGSWTIVTVSTTPAQVDIKANGLDGPITVTSGVPFTISWWYTGASLCGLDPAISTINIPPSGGGGSLITTLSASRTYSISCYPGNASDSVTVNITAPDFSLNVIKSGQGTIVSDVGGINCGTDCSKIYENGTVVNLTANPKPGRIFTGWGGVCSGKGACSVTVDANKTVTANFAVDPNYKEF